MGWWRAGWGGGELVEVVGSWLRWWRAGWGGGELVEVIDSPIERAFYTQPRCETWSVPPYRVALARRQRARGKRSVSAVRVTTLGALPGLRILLTGAPRAIIRAPHARYLPRRHYAQAMVAY